MEKTTNDLAPDSAFDALENHQDDSIVTAAETVTSFARPSVEEISLCCEISAYAPDGDDRPLF